MTDKQYLNEHILRLLLTRLDELKQQSKDTKSITIHMLQTLVEQSRQQA